MRTFILWLLLLFFYNCAFAHIHMLTIYNDSMYSPEITIYRTHNNQEIYPMFWTEPTKMLPTKGFIDRYVVKTKDNDGSAVIFGANGNFKDPNATDLSPNRGKGLDTLLLFCNVLHEPDPEIKFDWGIISHTRDNSREGYTKEFINEMCVAIENAEEDSATPEDEELLSANSTIIGNGGSEL